MQTSEMMARDSMLRAIPNHATSFRCAICGGTDLDVSIGQHDDGLIFRIDCRGCANYRDFLIQETD